MTRVSKETTYSDKKKLKHNVSTISLRSGKSYEYARKPVKEIDELATEKETEVGEKESEEAEKVRKKIPTQEKPILRKYKLIRTFPFRPKNTKHE